MFAADVSTCPQMADERTKALYNQKSLAPSMYSWASLAPKPETDNDRTQKYFVVPCSEIASDENNYDLSLSRYKEDVFAEVQYEAPMVILEKLLKVEVGDASDKDLAKIQSGIVRELLELRGMIG